MLEFTQQFGCFKKGHTKVICAMTTLKKAVRLLHDFIHETAILRKGFCFSPSEECCRSLFLFMNYCQISAGPVSWLSGAKSLLVLSLSSDCFYHDCRDGARKNKTRMITRLHLGLAPFIFPMWLLMIFRAAHYMLPAFPRMYCKSRGKVLFEVLRRTQVNAAASCKLNITSCNTANKGFKWDKDFLKISIDPTSLISWNNSRKENSNSWLSITCKSFIFNFCKLFLPASAYITRQCSMHIGVRCLRQFQGGLQKLTVAIETSTENYKENSTQVTETSQLSVCASVHHQGSEGSLCSFRIVFLVLVFCSWMNNGRRRFIF